MYAVFRTGGKQFRAELGKKLRVPSMDVEPGESITFDDVLLASDGNEVQVGAPTVDGAKVKAEILRHGRDKKIIVFKRKRRKNYRRKQGHRQGFTEVRVDEILV
jgi:large subunit ribosomal protein L21